MLYRVVWDVDSKTMAAEYQARDVAQIHRDDIAGWIPNARIEDINEDRPPYKSPFEVEPSKTRYERLGEETP